MQVLKGEEEALKIGGEAFKGNGTGVKGQSKGSDR